MKRNLLAFAAGVVVLLTMAAVTYQQGIVINKDYGDEPFLLGNSVNQTADWIIFKSNGREVFEIPANGMLAPAYGGTGTNKGITLPVYVIFTGTNGVTYTNRIINGTIR